MTEKSSEREIGNGSSCGCALWCTGLPAAPRDEQPCEEPRESLASRSPSTPSPLPLGSRGWLARSLAVGSRRREERPGGGIMPVRNDTGPDRPEGGRAATIEPLLCGRKKACSTDAEQHFPARTPPRPNGLTLRCAKEPRLNSVQPGTKPGVLPWRRRRGVSMGSSRAPASDRVHCEIPVTAFEECARGGYGFVGCSRQPGVLRGRAGEARLVLLPGRPLRECAEDEVCESARSWGRGNGVSDGSFRLRRSDTARRSGACTRPAR